MAATTLAPISGVPVPAAVGAPTQTGINADVAYPFAMTVQRLFLQNNSATALNVNLDATASLGTIRLAAAGTVGCSLQITAPCTNLHVYATSNTPLNGLAGGNLVILGWL